MTTTQIDDIMADPDLNGRAKRGRIFDYLAAQPDRGVRIATETLLGTEDRAVAEYVAQYLEIVPGAAEEKTLAAERLRGHPELVRSAARLVPWLPDDSLDRFVADYLAIGDPKAQLSSVIYSMAVHTPERLRPFQDQIKADHVLLALVAGSPDETVDELTTAWRSDGDLELLFELALVRTDYALTRVRSLREELEQSLWEMLVELAGGLPHQEGRSSYQPVFSGFVAAAGDSPHLVGGSAVGEVPICPICSAPTAPLLELKADALPYELAHDPVFYWYSCECDEMDSTTVRVGPDGLKVYYGPSGPADPDTRLAGGGRSLVLEPARNQRGTSARATVEQTGHQVGGLPRWSEADNHPRCPECAQAMPFIAFLTSKLGPFGQLDLGGIVYCFWCDDCQVSSTKVQD